MGLFIILVVGVGIGLAIGVGIRRESALPLVISTLVVLVTGILLACIRIVPAGHVGVVDFLGRVSPKELQGGLNFVNPLARVIKMSIRTQEDKETMSVPSKEGLTVALEVSVLYKLDPSKAVTIYRTVGRDYQGIILIPQYRAVARDITVSSEAKALYTSEREVLAQKFHDFLDILVKERGLTIEKVLLRSITLPPTVSTAIEQKLKTEQEAEQMEFVLLKETQEAERKRVEASGIKDAQSIINQSLTTQYLHYLWINTLNKNPNVIYVATEANLPLFRIADQDFENLHKKPMPEEEKK